MRTWYEKRPLAFALVWIGAYVVLFSAADGLSAQIGVEKCLTAPLSLLMAAVLVGWIFRQGLQGTLGLTWQRMDRRVSLGYLPLAVLASVNFWGGAAWPDDLLKMGLHILTMVCVGLLEEVIFRGLLFNALRRDNARWAVLMASVTFGMGHIINLLNGAAVLPTLLQIVYATAAGFMFTVLFMKGGSLIPCIVAHSVLNATSIFAVEQGQMLDVVSAVMLTVIALGYALWILKMSEKKKPE